MRQLKVVGMLYREFERKRESKEKVRLDLDRTDEGRKYIYKMNRKRGEKYLAVGAAKRPKASFQCAFSCFFL